MEYAYLGKITGKKEHVDRVSASLFPLTVELIIQGPQAISTTNLFYNADLSLSGGMYPTKWDLNEGKPSDRALTNARICKVINICCHKYVCQLGPLQIAAMSIHSSSI